MTSKQMPIHSGFTASSTAAEVVRGLDLHGQVMVVTGGYSGLGLETVRVLSEAGARVIVPARDVPRAEQALHSVPAAKVYALDLMDPHSIDAFADEVMDRYSALHVLINGAGIMANPLMRDARGYESQFSTNHLGHFQLAVQLWPALAAASGARIVAVSSRGHRLSPVDFDDPNFERRAYDRWLAYGQSKTANALFAVAADKRGKSSSIRAFSVHPGTILSNLSRHLSNDDLAGFGVTRENPHGYLPPGDSTAEGGIFKTIEQGAATAVWCAVSPQLNGYGGVYCENVDIAVVSKVSNPREPGVNPWAFDPDAAEKLWQLSERLTGTSL